MFGGNIINAKILIKEDWTVRYVYDWFGKNARLSTLDDKLYATIRTDDRAFKYWALQYTHLFTVIEPLDVRNEIIDILKQSLNQYKEQ